MTPSSKLGNAPAPEVKAPEVSGSVNAEQIKPEGGLSELERLEKELASKPAPGAKPGEKISSDPPGGPTPEPGEPKTRRRKFKRPPPENTIRMTIRQYWRFRAWLANRKLQLPAEMFAAVLDGTDQTLVEPLVEPVIGMIDEYIPEEWITFIEEKSPVLTFIIALFEAEQTFGTRIDQIARELRQEKLGPRAVETPPGGGGYPKKGEL